MEEYAFTEGHMGTDVTISLVTPTHELAQIIATRTFTLICEYEVRFSRFLLTSELTKLNSQRDMCVRGILYRTHAELRALYSNRWGI